MGDAAMNGNGNYQSFLARKAIADHASGFAPVWMPDFLFDFQAYLVDWAVRKGRCAIFADCGMGKTPIQLVWAENVVRHTNRPVLILTPLAVAEQTMREASKFGVACVHSRDGSVHSSPCAVVTNYERLHRFRPEDFSGVCCDESSILKNYTGATRNQIIEFVRTIPFRMLCSATPSPNDYTELGNSAEALGVMRRVEMLSMYFTHDQDATQGWRLKGHGVRPFWRFVASWARAVRFPSDIGFDDGPFVLPPIERKDHILPSEAPPGELFPRIAMTLNDQRRERKLTMRERCQMVSDIANSTIDPFLAWCSLNDESRMMASMIDGAVEVTGSQSDEEKEEKIKAFSSGEARCIVTKPSIAGFGLNWQHCSDMSFFPSHSHEQYYQAVRRCWRFGQDRPVTVNVVATESERAVMDNLDAKEKSATAMFEQIVSSMKEYYERSTTDYKPSTEVLIPSWM